MIKNIEIVINIPKRMDRGFKDLIGLNALCIFLLTQISSFSNISSFHFYETARRVRSPANEGLNLDPRRLNPAPESVKKEIEDIQRRGIMKSEEIDQAIQRLSILKSLPLFENLIPLVLGNNILLSVILDIVPATYIEGIDEGTFIKLWASLEELNLISGSKLKIQKLPQGRYLIYNEDKTIELFPSSIIQGVSRGLHLDWIHRVNENLITQNNVSPEKIQATQTIGKRVLRDGYDLRPLYSTLIKDIAILTYNRPERLEQTLGEMVKNLRLFGHKGITITVFDDSTLTSIQERNKEIIEKHRGEGINIVYFGPGEKTKYKSDLVEKLSKMNIGMGKEELKALIDRVLVIHTIGGNRNFVSTYFMGKKFISMDDDISPFVVRLKSSYCRKIISIINDTLVEMQMQGISNFQIVKAKVKEALQRKLPPDFIKFLREMKVPPLVSNTTSMYELFIDTLFGDTYPQNLFYLEESQTQIISAKQDVDFLLTFSLALSKPGITLTGLQFSGKHDFRIETILAYLVSSPGTAELPTAAILLTSRGDFKADPLYNVTGVRGGTMGVDGIDFTPFTSPRDIREEDFILSILHRILYPSEKNKAWELGMVLEHQRETSGRDSLIDALWKEKIGGLLFDALAFYYNEDYFSTHDWPISDGLSQVLYELSQKIRGEMPSSLRNTALEDRRTAQYLYSVMSGKPMFSTWADRLRELFYLDKDQEQFLDKVKNELSENLKVIGDALKLWHYFYRYLKEP